MGKKRRARPNRRFTPRPAAPAAPREERAAPREGIRPRFSRAGGIGRAAGEPSAGLLRAATVEYGYVKKDLRRIVLVAGGCLALLALATAAANSILG